MSSEAHELVVQMRPEGIEETESDLESVSNEFETTSESVGTSAEEMQGFSQQWQGAMTAVTAGLAVAATGLLSQVPVIGESMSGLFAILEGVAFQMDGVLRPVLSPLTTKFYEWSQAIFEADGAVGTLIGVIGTIVAVLGAAAGVVATAGAAFGGLAGAQTALVTAGQAVITAVGAVVGAIGAVPAAIAAVVAALALLTAAFITDWNGIRTKTVGAIKGILTWLGNLAGDGASLAGDFVDAVWDGLTGLGGDIKTWTGNTADKFTGLVDDAAGWGSDLIDEFVSGFQNAIPDLDGAVDKAKSTISDAISFDIRANDKMAERWGSDLMEHFSSGMEMGAKTVPGTEEALGGGGRSTPSFGASSSQDVAVYLDERRVDKGLARHRDDETNRRGRFG